MMKSRPRISVKIICFLGQLPFKFSVSAENQNTIIFQLPEKLQTPRFFMLSFKTQLSHAFLHPFRVLLPSAEKASTGGRVPRVAFCFSSVFALWFYSNFHILFVSVKD